MRNFSGDWELRCLLLWRGQKKIERAADLGEGGVSLNGNFHEGMIKWTLAHVFKVREEGRQPKGEMGRILVKV